MTSYSPLSAAYWCKYFWVRIARGPLLNFPAEKTVNRCVSKKHLKDIDATDVNHPAGTKLYINNSLCPYYRGLWNETKNCGTRKKNILLLMVKLG